MSGRSIIGMKQNKKYAIKAPIIEILKAQTRYPVRILCKAPMVDSGTVKIMEKIHTTAITRRVIRGVIILFNG